MASYDSRTLMEFLNYLGSGRKASLTTKIMNSLGLEWLVLEWVNIRWELEIVSQEKLGRETCKWMPSWLQL